MQGIIKKIVVKKYFGFIKADKYEYFFHKDDFKGHWDDLINDYETHGGIIPVEFEVKASPKGPRAIDVKRTDYPNQSV